MTQASFTLEELHRADLIDPRGNIIFSTGDPTFAMEDLSTTTIDTKMVSGLLESMVAPKGIRFVAAPFRKLAY